MNTEPDDVPVPLTADPDLKMVGLHLPGVGWVPDPNPNRRPLRQRLSAIIERIRP